MQACGNQSNAHRQSGGTRSALARLGTALPIPIVFFAMDPPCWFRTTVESVNNKSTGTMTATRRSLGKLDGSRIVLHTPRAVSGADIEHSRPAAEITVPVGASVDWHFMAQGSSTDSGRRSGADGDAHRRSGECLG